MGMKRKALGTIRTSLAMLAALPALGLASGGGAPVNIAGVWYGQSIVPPYSGVIETQLVVQEDASGNLTGSVTYALFCNSLGTCTNVTEAMTGNARSDGTFRMKTEEFELAGSITGSMTCLGGTVGTMLSGTVKDRSGTGSFGVDNCQ